MKKKLLIIAHPHSGSSLLKSMFGRARNAKEIINETQSIHNSELEAGKIVVAKTPLFTPELKELNLRHLQDHQLILLIRNPCFALKSLIMRFRGLETPSDHNQFFTVDYYDWILTEYINWEGPKIRYQDIFDRHKLRLLFENVGLEFNEEEIYGDYQRRISDIEIPTEKPDRTNHLEFRQFQINQKIEYFDKNRQIPQGEIYEKIMNLDSFQIIFKKKIKKRQEKKIKSRIR